MNLSKPLASLMPTLEADVLTVLAGADASFTGRQVHALVPESSESGIRKALKRLVAQGVVSQERVGSADIFRLDPSNLMTKHIKAVVDLRQEFFAEVSRDISNWKLEPSCGAIFGSAARSDMLAESDIDVFIARPNSIDFGDSEWRKQISYLSSNITRWTGNEAQIYELSESEIVTGLSKRDGVLISIINQGVVLFGPKDYLRALRYKKVSDADGR